ncbi:uncharacterized protein [Rutidosis leptorrhynchoides]|uniref:uncharacterized protein n=1 Tax=Rutidosis leptorrhynchoides TaxID=125765 RepID=UPI003A99BF7B
MGRGVRQGDPLSSFLFILAAKGLNILTKAAVDRGLFKGIEIGKDKIMVSHLQYADDTMFFSEWSKSNARNLINILKCSELASGLKVNFHKSCVYGVGVNPNETEGLASRMGCKAGKFPFIYLGLPIGAKMKKISDWDPVIDKFKKRLSDWKMRTLSYGGRLVLLNSVLNSLPLYYFALFRAPPCVLKLLENHSFNNPIGDGRNTLFWKDIWCGSTCFKDLFPRIFRLETNQNVSIRERILVPAANSDAVPTETKIPEAVSSANVDAAPPDAVTHSFTAPTNAITPSFAAFVASANTADLSTDFFAGITDPEPPDPMRTTTPTAQHNSIISDSSVSNDQSLLFLWNWSRDPTGRTLDELIEGENLIKSIHFDFESQDHVKWSLANDGVFTVKKLSSLLDDHILGTPSTPPRMTLRNNLVPKKLEIFVWRALRCRIPVRIELDKRGIDLHSVRCPVCDDDLESVEHLFFNCKESLDVWNRVYKWWNFGSCSFSNTCDILHGKSTCNMTPLGKKICEMDLLVQAETVTAVVAAQWCDSSWFTKKIQRNSKQKAAGFDGCCRLMSVKDCSSRYGCLIRKKRCSSDGGFQQ